MRALGLLILYSHGEITNTFLLFHSSIKRYTNGPTDHVADYEVPTKYVRLTIPRKNVTHIHLNSIVVRK